jgi:hypothetical protein
MVSTFSKPVSARSLLTAPFSENPLFALPVPMLIVLPCGKI